MRSQPLGKCRADKMKGENKMTMKERIAEQGGLFSCAFEAKNGRRSSRCIVRAHNAKEARTKIIKIVKCALVMFAVKAYVQ